MATATLPNFILSDPIHLQAAGPLDDNLYKLVFIGENNALTVYGTFDSWEQLVSLYGNDKLFYVNVTLDPAEPKEEIETNVISFEDYKKRNIK